MALWQRWLFGMSMWTRCQTSVWCQPVSPLSILDWLENGIRAAFKARLNYMAMYGVECRICTCIYVYVCTDPWMIVDKNVYIYIYIYTFWIHLHMVYGIPTPQSKSCHLWSWHQVPINKALAAQQRIPVNPSQHLADLVWALATCAVRQMPLLDALGAEARPVFRDFPRVAVPVVGAVAKLPVHWHWSKAFVVPYYCMLCHFKHWQIHDYLSLLLLSLSHWFVNELCYHYDYLPLWLFAILIIYHCLFVISYVLFIAYVLLLFMGYYLFCIAYYVLVFIVMSHCLWLLICYFLLFIIFC